MARAAFVKRAQKDIPGTDIKAGDSYYWWKFRRSGKRFSKTRPKRSQLTQSSFYAAIFDLEDDVIAKAAADDGLAGIRDDIVSTLEDLKSDCESALDNMPDGLRESSSSGQLLQERIDALESAIEEFESLELDEPGDEDLEVEAIEKNEGEPDEAFEARKSEALEQARQEYWESKLSELQAISIEAP